MKILRGYKTELKLNNTQKTACAKHAGTARFTYNWGLQIKINEYKRTGKSPNAMELHKRLVLLKKTEFSWMYEVSKCAPQEALRDLEKAFNNFFRRVKNGEKPKFPKFKSRKNGIGSFRLNAPIRVENSRVRLPRLGWLRLKEKGYLPLDTKILSATVSERAGRWFVSLQVEEERPDAERLIPLRSCGVDVGIINLATLDNGTVFKNPRALNRMEQKLKSRQKALSRKQLDSKNWKKAKHNLRRLHYRIACIRKDALHKTTTAITKQYRTIGIESLDVQGMLKNHKLAKSLSDASFYEFHRQIKYKTRWNGGQVIEVDRFYPSSKLCSRCGFIKQDLSLTDRVFVCDRCGFVMSRDQNAAINLKKSTVSSMGFEACGEERLQPFDVAQGSAPQRSRNQTLNGFILFG